MELQNLLEVVLGAVLSVAALFAATKLMGNRQMSQLSMFDYVNGITIGSIAAEMATAQEDMLKPFIAIVVYTLIALAISLSTSKSIALRRVLTGKTILLFDRGKFYRSNLKKAHIDMSEFLMQCRTNGYFNLNDLRAVLLEPNGKLSFFEKAEARAVRPPDMQLAVAPENLCLSLIMDGEILRDNLKAIGFDENWLQKQLQAQSVNNLADVALAFYDGSVLSLYKRIDAPATRDIFQ